MSANRFSPGAPCCSGYTLYRTRTKDIGGVTHGVIVRVQERDTTKESDTLPDPYKFEFIVPFISGRSPTLFNLLSYDGFFFFFANGVFVPNSPTQPPYKLYKVNQTTGEIVWVSDDIPFSPVMMTIDKWRNRIFISTVFSLPGDRYIGSVHYDTGEWLHDPKRLFEGALEGPTPGPTVNYSLAFRNMRTNLYNGAASYVVNERWTDSGTPGHVTRWEAGILNLAARQVGGVDGWTMTTSGDFGGSGELGGFFDNTEVNGAPASVGYVHPFDETSQESGVFFIIKYSPPAPGAVRHIWRFPPVVHFYPSPPPGGLYQETGDEPASQHSFGSFRVDPSNGLNIQGQKNAPTFTSWFHFRGVYQNVLYWFDGSLATGQQFFYPHWSTYGLIPSATPGPIASHPDVAVPSNPHRFSGDMDNLKQIANTPFSYFNNVVPPVGFIAKADNFGAVVI